MRRHRRPCRRPLHSHRRRQQTRRRTPPARHQQRMGRHRASLHTPHRRASGQRAPLPLGPLAVLLGHSRALRHRFAQHRREIRAALEHTHDTHGRHRPQRHRPLHLRGRLRVAPRQHQPPLHQGQGRQDRRKQLRRQPRRAHARIHDLPAALRRRRAPARQSGRRSRHHPRPSRPHRPRMQNHSLRHKHPPGRLRLALRHGRHQHPLPRTQLRDSQPRLQRRRQNGSLHGTRHGRHPRRHTLSHRPRAQLHGNDVRHPHIRFRAHTARRTPRRARSHGGRPHLSLRPLRQPLRRLPAA